MKKIVINKDKNLKNLKKNFFIKFYYKGLINSVKIVNQNDKNNQNKNENEKDNIKEEENINEIINIFNNTNNEK